MKSINIVKRLKKEGYKIVYKKWGYWNNIPHVQLDGFDFAIVEIKHNGNWQSCKVDFIYGHVQHALSIAQNNNPIIVRKIEQVPLEDWYYNRYLILSMEDYYLYRKNIYPFDDDYYNVLERLKRI